MDVFYGGFLFSLDELVTELRVDRNNFCVNSSNGNSNTEPWYIIKTSKNGIASPLEADYYDVYHSLFKNNS